jgi:hypothetical protein
VTKASCRALVALILMAGAAGAQAQSARPAIDAILAAFQTHAIVGMHNDEGGDNHDLAQQHDFYAALVRDPRFARQVGNIVVEFASGAHQAVMDRYVNGEDVPYLELRKVWTDTVGWTPPPFNLGYVNLFAQVRAVNQGLPPGQRIHVWLGEPPVDWSKVQKPEDVFPAGTNIMSFRDDYTTALIEREVFGRRRKALVIYGNFHFATDPQLLAEIPGYTSMGARIEARHPGAIFHVETYSGLANKGCNAEFEKDKAGLTLPVLIAPAQDAALGNPVFTRRCVLQANAPIDALLYLGAAASLTSSPLMPDAYLDGAYLKELQRRWDILKMTATPSELNITVDKNGVSPKAFVTHDDIDSGMVALAERAKTDIASPEAEAALRRFIAGMQAGRPPLEELSPELAAAVGAQSARMQPMIKGLGALKTVRFLHVARNGADIYMAEFETSKTEWTISPPVNGKIFVLGFRRLAG